MIEESVTFNHATSYYLGRISLSIELLRKTSDEVLSIFSDSLFELLYIAVVAGVEKYMEDRLLIEVFYSDDATRRYIDCHDNLVARYKAFFNSLGIESTPPKQPNQFYNIEFPLNRKLKDVITNSVKCQTFHRLDIMATYLHFISDLDVQVWNLWHQFESVIKLRHRIIHHGSIDEDGERIHLKIYEVNDACDLAEKIISKTEYFFVKQKGHPEVFEDPTIE